MSAWIASRCESTGSWRGFAVSSRSFPTSIDLNSGVTREVSPLVRTRTNLALAARALQGRGSLGLKARNDESPTDAGLSERARQDSTCGLRFRRPNMAGVARPVRRASCWGNRWGNMPHGLQPIPDELNPPETALVRCPAAPLGRAHNPKVAGSNPAPATPGSPANGGVRLRQDSRPPGGACPAGQAPPGCARG